MIVMTAATRQEIDGISRCLVNKHRVAGDGCTAWQGDYKGKEVLAVQTGIGRAMVERVIGSILASYHTNALISLGFGGALAEGLHVGDLVICTSVFPWDETDDVSPIPYQADEYLVKCAVAAMDGKRPKWIRGTSVTVPGLVSNADGKYVLRNRVQAEVCEMEDYWVARTASARQIPFLAVRVIYDEVNTMLPDYGRMLDQGGNVGLGRTITYLINHPGQLFCALTSYQNYCRAKDNLSIFAESFLDSLRLVLVRK